MSVALARLFYSPLHYAGALVLALALALALSIRNEGWLPPFRQWRIRRVLLLALLGWGLAVLSHAVTAQPVAHRRDQPDSARELGAKTPAADVPDLPHRHRTCTAAASVAPQAAPISALHASPLDAGRPLTASRALLSPEPPRTRATHEAAQ